MSLDHESSVAIPESRFRPWGLRQIGIQIIPSNSRVAAESSGPRGQIRFQQPASVAAEPIGAARRISVENFLDACTIKRFLMTMEDGREAVAKVSNPNAGISHFTTASGVATVKLVS
ncbi:phosphotransferase enzyme family protein [Penicillium canescens]|uniref:Phosphotransferase enzyme family protein n=1 Tax=Penicillium canescens TaxID=5083 RepID=A0AAD6NCE1_PENCN|nr:phosphotransferase enzyme family protein [Penicillium canescens]KAJ6007074.1 phosphotransferase enzyme family protein [Penicillium canescens]KAJ6029586.1 phosphotransferase enzyme family protein [Penicillium canescens]KAJ6048018.1 phosphotransferase enzyme family protein [Penicillium canescens]KAJ6048380.1 phosphotransferase enzyme family protein [Penicillium canescens]KAJ6101103.1 phosphotransferase enzyme family protein [Penicillium canescens]